MLVVLFRRFQRKFDRRYGRDETSQGVSTALPIPNGTSSAQLNGNPTQSTITAGPGSSAPNSGESIWRKLGLRTGRAALHTLSV